MIRINFSEVPSVPAVGPFSYRWVNDFPYTYDPKNGKHCRFDKWFF